MNANLLQRERSLKNAVLCASFDRKLRAEIMNARENVRLEKQHRNIDAFKSSFAKEHMAERNRVKSRMQDLRKTVLCRAQSLDKVDSAVGHKADALNGVHLPKLPIKQVEIGRKMTGETDLTRSLPDIHLIYTENEPQKSTQLPMVTLNSPRGKRRFKNRGYNVRNALTNSPRMRTQSHGDLRSDECEMVKDINCNLKNSLEINEMTLKSDQEIDQRLEGISNRREFLDPSHLQGYSLTSRRRSLSTGDITLAEKIHSFLEGVENSRVSSNSLDCSSSNSEEEDDVI